MRLLKLQKSGFVDFERLRKEPFGDKIIGEKYTVNV